MLEELEIIEILEILEILELLDNLKIPIIWARRISWGGWPSLPLEEGGDDFSLFYEEGQGDEDAHEEHIARGES